MDVNTPEREPPPPPPPLLHAICSQIYNAISHHVHDAAKFHEARLGLIMTFLVGMTASSLLSKNRWQHNLDHCHGDLLHFRCIQKVIHRTWATSVHVVQEHVPSGHETSSRKEVQWRVSVINPLFQTDHS